PVNLLGSPQLQIRHRPYWAQFLVATLKPKSTEKEVSAINNSFRLISAVKPTTCIPYNPGFFTTLEDRSIDSHRIEKGDTYPRFLTTANESGEGNADLNKAEITDNKLKEPVLQQQETLPENETPKSCIPIYNVYAMFKDSSRPPDSHYPPGPAPSYRRADCGSSKIKSFKISEVSCKLYAQCVQKRPLRSHSTPVHGILASDCSS
ncbi:hypothetical protein SFRURICE_004737, partial [Spodoptera frugiperda]